MPDVPEEKVEKAKQEAKEARERGDNATAEGIETWIDGLR